MNRHTFFTLLMLVSAATAQQFTKITQGAPVSDGGESFGISWIDVDSDGFLDLYISNGGAASVRENNFLYRNAGNGTFMKELSDPIVHDSDITIGSVWGDIDNDGDIDAFLVNRDGRSNMIFLNNGKGTFSRVDTGIAVTDGGNSNGGSIVDIDRDGLLDLFVVNFFGERQLYKNLGSGQFEKITGQSISSDATTSISCAWGDYDNDGGPDVVVVNAAGAGALNNLYRNDSSFSFLKQSLPPVTTDRSASMGGAWGDYDNDGDLDLFIANQANHNNNLYKNNGAGMFEKVTAGSIVTDGGQSISPSWVDVENDGDLDLFITNWQGQNDFLYLNDGYPDYTFTKVTSGPIVEENISTMGAAWGDYDNDGDQDLFCAVRSGLNNLLFRNESAENHWISFRLTGVESNTSAIGARVRVKATINGVSQWQMREVMPQHGYNSQNDIRPSFGLGSADIVDSVVIVWPSGMEQRFCCLQPNTFYSLSEGGSLISSLRTPDVRSIPSKADLYQNYPNPFNPSTVITYTVPLSSGKPSHVVLRVFDVTGREVARLADDLQYVGTYTVRFDGTPLASGAYIYELTVGSARTARRMILHR